MHNFLISFIIFIFLSFSALATMFLHRKMRPHYWDDETAAVVRLIANIFVVMTSLVFGLMMNSAKNTYEAIDANVHAFGTDIIVLDRTLRNYGPDAAEARKQLDLYVEEAILNPTRGSDNHQDKPDLTGQLLDKLGKELARIEPTSDYKAHILLDIRQQYHNIVEQRWGLIEKSEGSMPIPIIVMLAAWLTLIFASYGYRSPKNAVTISMVIISAFLISSSLYLVLDMNVPFSGPISISDIPLKRALIEIRS
jgi:hypothetical protein